MLFWEMGFQSRNNAHQSIIISLSASKNCLADAEKIFQQLDSFGYAVNYRSSILAPPEIDSRVEIIVTDFSVESMKTLKRFSEQRSLEGQKHPLVFMGSRGGFDERLEAVKLGGDAFLLTEDTEIQLLDTLGTLLPSIDNGYNVLIVDDDVDLTDYYSLVLEEAGIHSSVANYPEEALNILQRQTIDLVLLDLRMPRCNGLEFACILRQLNDYIRLPIVFMSANTPGATYEKILKQSLGADDFLAKPISNELLIDTIKHRCARSRVLQQIMQRDSATQLLNHSAFKKEVALEVKRASRSSSNFSYVLIDLDYFKSVNDVFGHAAGDMVLKIFSHMLRSRLRITDVIGRYGGEEFGVLLLDTSAEYAQGVICALLKKLSSTPFLADDKEFHVTFSAGIAEYARFPDAAALNKAADEALYIAKNQGRKRVVIAS